MSTTFRVVILLALLAGEGCMGRAWAYDETHRIGEVMRAEAFTEHTPGAQGIALVPQARPLPSPMNPGASSSNEPGYQLSSFPSSSSRRRGSGGGYGSSTRSSYGRRRNRNAGYGYGSSSYGTGYANSGYANGTGYPLRPRRRTRRRTSYNFRPRRAYPSTYTGLNYGSLGYGLGDWNTFDTNCFCTL